MTKPPARALKLSRKCLVLAASITLSCPIAFAQSPAYPGATSSASPAAAFEVSTIKPHPPTTGNIVTTGESDTPSGLSATNMTLFQLVQIAYGLHTQTQNAHFPDWAKSQPYDIEAKMSEADIAAMKTLSPAQQDARHQKMFQTLLAERFKLKMHSDTTQIPVYDLVTTKDIAKLRDATTDPGRKLNKDGKPRTGIDFAKDSADVMGKSMPDFADFLADILKDSSMARPVVDKTRLTSTYDFTLKWSINSARPGSTADSHEDDTASIFGALKEVGLKLQPSTGPSETIVIDHIERPSEN